MAFTDWLDATLVARVRSMLNEPNALSFTNTELLRWIDRGANVLLSTTKGKESLALYALTEGGDTIPYASLFGTTPAGINVETVFYTAAATATVQTAQAGYCLRKAHPREFATSPFTSTDTPKLWAERAENILIHPSPTAVGNDAVAKMIAVLYYQNVNTFDNGTVNATYVYPDTSGNTACNLPEHMQEAVTWYALAKANEKLKRYGVAMMFMSIFMNLAVFYRQDSNPKPVDSRDMMTAPDYTQFAQ